MVRYLEHGGTRKRGKGELGFQKLPGVGNFFNGWQPDPPPPPTPKKRKCQAEKGSLTKNKSKFYWNYKLVRKDIIFQVRLLMLMLSGLNMVWTMPISRCHIEVEAIQMELWMANSSIAHQRAMESKNNIPTMSHTLYTCIGWQHCNFLSHYWQVSHKYKLWLPSYPVFAMSTLAMLVLHQLWTQFGLWWVIEKPLLCLWLTESEVSYYQGIWMETRTVTQGRLIKMVYQSVKTSRGINVHIHCYVDLQYWLTLLHHIVDSMPLSKHHI